MEASDLKGKDITSWFDSCDLAPFKSYSVRLIPSRDLRAEHRCEGGHIDVCVPDYLKDAPYTVLQDIVRCAVQNRPIFTDAVRGYIKRDDFIEINRPVYLDRMERFTRQSAGREKDLQESIERLEKLGLISEADYRNSSYTWIKHKTTTFWGRCNMIFRVVSINPMLDDQRIPDTILDRVVYHETLHLRQSTMGVWRGHDKQFIEWENRFPGLKETDALIDEGMPS